MSRSSPHDSTSTRRALPALLALVATAALFPPETRGESLAGCGALIALAAALHWSGRFDASRAWPLVAALALAAPVVRTSLAPGSAVEPVAIWFLAPVVGLAAAALPKDARLGRALPATLAAAAAAVSCHALVQLTWSLPALVARIEAGLPVADRAAVLERAAAGRAFAGFPTPAALGGFLALAIPVTVGAAIGSRGRARVALVAAAGLQAVALVASASATGAAALVGASLVAVLAWRARPATRVAAVVAALVLLAAIVGLRGAEIVDPSHGNSPWRLRAANASLAVRVIADHPVTGVGPGNFGEAYPRYRGPRDNESRHVHDLPLELAAEIGIPAGALLSATFLVLFLGPLFRRSAEQPAWWRGAAIGLAAFALHNLVDFTAFLPSLLWIAATVRGWVARGEARRDAVPAHPLGLSLVAASVLAAVLAGLGGLAWNARADGRHARAAGDLERAASAAERATRLAPWHPDGWLLAAGARLDDAGAPAGRALEAATRAVAASPVRPSARRVRALARLRAGDSPGALQDAVVAAEAYPMSTEYRELAERLTEDVRRSLPRRTTP